MILNNLKAAGETILFLGRGVDRFDGSVRAAWYSMLIPLFLSVYGFWQIGQIAPLGAEEADPVRLGIVSLLVRAVSIGVFIAFVYGFAYTQDKRENFPRVITASNWSGLLIFVLTLPVSLMAVTGTLSRQTFEDLMIWLLIYGYAVTGFILWRAFRLPWELAAALGVFVLFINQTTRMMIFRLADIPLLDYFDVY